MDKKENGFVRVLKKIFVKDILFKILGLVSGFVLWFIIRVVIFNA